MYANIQAALMNALKELKDAHPELQVANWGWTSVTLPPDCSGEIQKAKQPQLLLVTAGAGSIISNDVANSADCGYWAFIPKGVSYTLRGRVSAGGNFQVVTLALR